MLEIEMENARVERLQLQRLGEDWIQAIKEGDINQLEQFCNPQITSLLLTPNHLQKLDNVADLVATYHDWFDEYSNFHLEASRVGLVGGKLGISYRFLLQNQGDWYMIEQQLYCTLKNGRVSHLNLLCSGFQPVEENKQAVYDDAPESRETDPVRDALLEYHADAPETSSTCAFLTPAIKSKLREMQTGQVLEVRVNDPSARDDIEAWSRLSGNALLKMIDDGNQELRFFLKKK